MKTGLQARTAAILSAAFILITVQPSSAQYVGSGFRNGPAPSYSAASNPTPALVSPVLPNGSASTASAVQTKAIGGGVSVSNRGVSGIGAINIGPVTVAGGRSGGNWFLNLFLGGGAGFFGGYSDPRIEAQACNIFGLVEGSFGALVMVVAGLIAVVAAALGAYRAALATIVVGAGSWVLYPIVTLFFGPLCWY